MALKPPIASPAQPRRGEVWLVEFQPSRGAEISKTRPAVVMSLDSVGKLPLRLVVPLTSWQPQFTGVPWLIPILPTPANGLTNHSAADAFQASSFSTGRFLKRFGELEEVEVEKIARAIATSVGARP